MTDDEARRLVPGAVVETTIGRDRVPVVVVGFDRAYGRNMVRVRRTLTRARDGGAWPSFRRLPECLDWPTTPPGMDPVTGNVFADWLDERGEHRAAAMLREAFPYAPPAG